MSGLTLGDVNLGVSGGLGPDLSELLEVLDREVVAEHVQHDVLERATIHRAQERRTWEVS